MFVKFTAKLSVTEKEVYSISSQSVELDIIDAEKVIAGTDVSAVVTSKGKTLFQHYWNIEIFYFMFYFESFLRSIETRTSHKIVIFI